MATLSPGAQLLLEDQKWHEKLQIRHWRPLLWFIPSTVWFVLGVLVLIGFAIAAADGTASRWELGDYLTIVVVAAGTVLAGHYARRRRRARRAL
jgi:hypothetical protein